MSLGDLVHNGGKWSPLRGAPFFQKKKRGPASRGPDQDQVKNFNFLMQCNPKYALISILIVDVAFCFRILKGLADPC